MSSFVGQKVIAPLEFVEVLSDETGSGVLNFANSSVFQSGTYDDIQIRCSGPYYTFRRFAGKLSVYVPADSNWIEIPSSKPEPPTMCTFSCIAATSRLASELPGTVVADVLDELGRMRVSAEGSSSFDGWLIDYSPDYHFRVIRSERAPFSYKGAIGFRDNALYMYASYLADDDLTPTDSLIGLDLLGNRRWSVSTPSCSGCLTAFGEESYWTFNQVVNELARIDTLGQVLNVFPTIGLSIEQMTWADGNLWCATFDRELGVTHFYMIDVDSTMSSGETVWSHKFDLGQLTILTVSADSSGLLLTSQYPEPLLIRCSFDGTITDRLTFDLESGVGVSAMTWDGDSHWVLHHGAFSASTPATLLSRFKFQ